MVQDTIQQLQIKLDGLACTVLLLFNFKVNSLIETPILSMGLVGFPTIIIYHTHPCVILHIRASQGI